MNAKYLQVIDWIIPISSIGDVGNCQHHVIFRKIKDSPRVQCIDIGLNDTGAIWSSESLLMEDGVDGNIFQNIASEVAKDVEWVGVLAECKSRVTLSAIQRNNLRLTTIPSHRRH